MGCRAEASLNLGWVLWREASARWFGSNCAYKVSALALMPQLHKAMLDVVEEVQLGAK